MRSAAGAKMREGLQPNGRDGKGGTGRSPKSPAAHRADTPRPFRDFQTGNANMRTMESESSVLLRAIQGAGREMLHESRHCARFGLQAHVGQPLPGWMLGYFNAAARAPAKVAAFWFGCWP